MYTKLWHFKCCRWFFFLFTAYKKYRKTYIVIMRRIDVKYSVSEGECELKNTREKPGDGGLARGNISILKIRHGT